MPTIKTIASIISFANVFDIFCLLLIAGHLLAGYRRGFGRMIASLIGTLLALLSGYWLHPTLASWTQGTSFGQQHPNIVALSPYLLAIAIGIAVFFILRMLLGRFFRLLVEQPVDHIFGSLGGLVIGLVLVMLMVSIGIVLPQNSRLRRIVCEESRTGSIITPAVQSILNARHVPTLHFGSRQEDDDGARPRIRHKESLLKEPSLPKNKEQPGIPGQPRRGGTGR